MKTKLSLWSWDWEQHISDRNFVLVKMPVPSMLLHAKFACSVCLSCLLLSYFLLLKNWLFICVAIFHYITRYTSHAPSADASSHMLAAKYLAGGSSTAFRHCTTGMLKSALCVLKPWHAAGIIDVFVSTNKCEISWHFSSRSWGKFCYGCTYTFL